MKKPVYVIVHVAGRRDRSSLPTLSKIDDFRIMEPGRGVYLSQLFIVFSAFGTPVTRAEPGTVYWVDEETYFDYLEVLPPRCLSGSVFALVEGDVPFLLFWRDKGRGYLATLLTSVGSPEDEHRL